MFHLMKSHIQNVASFKYSINNSIARFTNRSYVISEVNKFIESRFVRFCTFRIDVWSSSSESTSLREFARKLQNTHRWRSSRSHFVERVCWQQWQSLTSFNRSKSIELREFARKLQNMHLWESFRTCRFEKASELIVERARICIVEEACTKTSDIMISALDRRHRQKRQTNAVRECWKYNFRRCCNQEIIW